MTVIAKSKAEGPVIRLEKYELPEGWILAPLCDVAKPSKEKIQPSECRSSPYLSLEHIEANTGRIIGRGTGADITSTKAVFHAGDVLYGKLRPYLNKVCIPDFDGICSTDILVFPKSKILQSQLLKMFLSGNKVVRFANHHMQGVQLPRISFEKLSELDFPLPPPAEQQRIVARVELLLAGVNAARDRLAKVPAILKRFRQSVLAAACSGRLTADWRQQNPDVETDYRLYAKNSNVGQQKKEPVGPAKGTFEELPDKWHRVSLASICADIVDCSHSTPKWTEHGRLCIRTTNFLPGLLNLTNKQYVSEETYKKRIERLAPRAGDVLYSREGGILGVACIIPKHVELCLGQRMMLMRPVTNFSSEFFMHVLNCPETIAAVREMTGGSASPHLNVGDVKQFAIPLPSVVEQQEIVHRVELLFNLADKIEKRVKAAMARTEKLTQTILTKAFRGELVPTEAELARREGRQYESAGVLLERIKAQCKPKQKTYYLESKTKV